MQLLSNNEFMLVNAHEFNIQKVVAPSYNEEQLDFYLSDATYGTHGAILYKELLVKILEEIDKDESLEESMKQIVISKIRSRVVKRFKSLLEEAPEENKTPGNNAKFWPYHRLIELTRADEEVREDLLEALKSAELVLGNQELFRTALEVLSRLRVNIDPVILNRITNGPQPFNWYVKHFYNPEGKA